MTYVDGFVAAVPTANKEQYIKHASEDPRIQPNVNPMPFDGKRLIFGGFETVVDE